MPTRLINLYGAPCSGKSVMMLRLAVAAKLRGQFCEICPEVAKEYVVREITITGPIQWDITLEQYSRLTRFIGHADFLITDAPVLIGAFYAADHAYPEAGALLTAARDMHRQFMDAADVVNVYVTRNHPYLPHGRYQDEAAARRIEREMLAFVRTHHDPASLIEVPSTTDLDALWQRVLASPPEQPALPSQ